MDYKKSPGLWIETGDSENISVVMVNGNRQERRLQPVTPAQALVDASEIDYTEYREEIKRLYEGHPLFEEKLDIRESDFVDFVAEALMLPSLLCEIDPVSFFELGYLLDYALQMRDDGSASFLLRAGQKLLQVLEIPILTQIRLHNIMEMSFDGMERATQQERFERLRSVYPDIAQFCDPARLNEYDNIPTLIHVGSVYQLRLAELMLYFRQDKKRISRCDYCWSYFVPKSRAVTLYCDKLFDGQSCKLRGPRLKRKCGPEQDEALKLFQQLRDRMYARMERYRDAPENGRGRLIPITIAQYGEWEENARRARQDYIAGKITAEAFLRRIDITHELISYNTFKQELPDETVWQKRVAANPDFDPERQYPQSFMILDLGADEGNQQWQYFTAEDLIRREQEGHQSLRDKYGKR